MLVPQTLDIRGYQNMTVPHAFFRQEQSLGHLALVFPGLGYNAHMPVLYYPTRLLLERGADLLRVDYNYMGADYQGLSRQEQSEWLRSDVLAAYQTAIGQRSYSRVTLIGKSIGTLALGHILDCVADLQACCIWLTPLLRIQRLREQIAANRQPGLFVIGSADSHYDPVLLAEVEAASAGRSLMIDKADHSLEIAGDLKASIQAQARVIEAIEGLLSNLG